MGTSRRQTLHTRRGGCTACLTHGRSLRRAEGRLRTQDAPSAAARRAASGARKTRAAPSVCADTRRGRARRRRRPRRQRQRQDAQRDHPWARRSVPMREMLLSRDMSCVRKLAGRAERLPSQCGRQKRATTTSRAVAHSSLDSLPARPPPCSFIHVHVWTKAAPRNPTRARKKEPETPVETAARAPVF